MRSIPVCHMNGQEYESYSNILSYARAEFVHWWMDAHKTGIPDAFGRFNRWLESNHGFTFDYSTNDGITSINIVDEQKFLVFLLRYKYA